MNLYIRFIEKSDSPEMQDLSVGTSRKQVNAKIVKTSKSISVYERGSTRVLYIYLVIISYIDSLNFNTRVA